MKFVPHNIQAALHVYYRKRSLIEMLFEHPFIASFKATVKTYNKTRGFADMELQRAVQQLLLSAPLPERAHPAHVVYREVLRCLFNIHPKCTMTAVADAIAVLRSMRRLSAVLLDELKKLFGSSSSESYCLRFGLERSIHIISNTHYADIISQLYSFNDDYAERILLHTIASPKPEWASKNYIDMRAKCTIYSESMQAVFIRCFKDCIFPVADLYECLYLLEAQHLISEEMFEELVRFKQVNLLVALHKAKLLQPHVMQLILNKSFDKGLQLFLPIFYIRNTINLDICKSVSRYFTFTSLARLLRDYNFACRNNIEVREHLGCDIAYPRYLEHPRRVQYMPIQANRELYKQSIQPVYRDPVSGGMIYYSCSSSPYVSNNYIAILGQFRSYGFAFSSMVDTQLMRALLHSDLERMQAYLADGIDPNRYIESDFLLELALPACSSMFWVAIVLNDLEMVKLLLESGVVPEIVTLGLRYFCSVEVFELLINHGASINQQDDQGCTALMAAVTQDDVFRIGALLALSNTQLRDNQGNTLLHYFVDHHYCISALYYQCPNSIEQQVNIKNSQGVTPLLQAVRSGKLALVTQFVDHYSGDTAICNSLGDNMLHIAISILHEGLIDYCVNCLQHDVNQTNSNGDSPAHLLLAQSPSIGKYKS